MSELQQTPSANRLHIAILGKRNMGKSTLINALTGQSLAIVSAQPGTTTDPVYKAMEILPIGPCTIIDTAGLDDEGELGQLRVEKTLQVLRKTDIALLTITAAGLTDFDSQLLAQLRRNDIPVIVVINKQDQLRAEPELLAQLHQLGLPHLSLSAQHSDGIDSLKQLIIQHSPKTFEQPSLLGDLVQAGDSVVLVIPVDSGMPKGRLILPQVQTMRDLLDNNVLFQVCKPEQLPTLLANMVTPPKLVITDSQVFQQVAAATPDDIALTSFSILFARHKGDLLKLVQGAKALSQLSAGDKVFIAEACTHHCQAEDIGRVKIPGWIRQHIEAEIEFGFCAGRDYPADLANYQLVIHCGACMLNRKEMLSRIELSNRCGVPVLNYGLCIAAMHGILDRALRPFADVHQAWLDGKA
ncbi:[FeFe] hydrogenase H-cluster maturation GTPase HydF [Ferrimonas senticii]|uniref:[FeFe] hydrogenase H-cluster maturation GTPase HydF n=1 Tax=Ferrimonas senticii TaxID=394566 RepID=UPI00040AEE38|nr:[FeFe] hydrogenase H-cluster maturation GTPase HydF [Ferrimonas senticii]